MSKRWIVHRENGEILGPWSAPEIRDALRNGRIEAFDKVHVEGSSEFQELVEVDEIFQTTRLAQSSAEASAPSRDNEKTALLAPGAGTRVSPAKEAPEGGERYLGLADPSAAAFPLSNHFEPTAGDGHHKPPKDKGSDKKFYLIDEQKKKNGPFSAADIQSLYHHHNLSERIKVRKKGASGEIAIRQFVEIYEKSSNLSLRVKERGGPPPPPPGRGPLARPRSFPYAPARARPLPYAAGVPSDDRGGSLLFITLAALIVVGLVVFSSTLLNKREAKPRENLEKKARKLEPKDEAREPGPAKDGNINLIDAENLRRASDGEDGKRDLPGKIKPSPPARRGSTPTVAPSPQPEEVQSTGTFSSLQLAQAHSGQVVTIGPLTFTEADLQTCQQSQQKKCTVGMRDSGGRVLLVKFFEIHYTRLTGKGSRVYVTGLLDQGGSSLYLMRVF